jgi:hypothetical protein
MRPPKTSSNALLEVFSFWGVRAGHRFAPNRGKSRELRLWRARVASAMPPAATFNTDRCSRRGHPRTRRSLSLEEVPRQHRNLGPIPGVEFSHDMPKVNLDRVLAHIEFVGDLLVGFTVGHFLGDFHLPRRQ